MLASLQDDVRQLLMRQASTFARGSSKYPGVAKHKVAHCNPNLTLRAGSPLNPSTFPFSPLSFTPLPSQLHTLPTALPCLVLPGCLALPGARPAPALLFPAHSKQSEHLAVLCYLATCLDLAHVSLDQSTSAVLHLVGACTICQLTKNGIQSVCSQKLGQPYTALDTNTGSATCCPTSQSVCNLNVEPSMLVTWWQISMAVMSSCNASLKSHRHTSCIAVQKVTLGLSHIQAMTCSTACCAA